MKPLRALAAVADFSQLSLQKTSGGEKNQRNSNLARGAGITKLDFWFTLQLGSGVSSVRGFTPFPHSLLQGERNNKKILNWYFQQVGPQYSPSVHWEVLFFFIIFFFEKSGTICCLGEKRRHFSSEDVGDKFTLLFILIVHSWCRKDMKIWKFNV